MPYKNPKDRKKQKNAPRGSAAFEARMERQRARRAFDKKNGKSARNGKDISHNKALSKGGSNKDGYNRSRNYKKKK
jgi:hypothetical protein